MLMPPSWPGTTGLASMSSLATLIRPSYSPASSSTTGPIILHGEHHEAQKSTRTGTSESMTSDLKVVSVTVTGWAMKLSRGRGADPARLAITECDAAQAASNLRSQSLLAGAGAGAEVPALFDSDFDSFFAGS